MNLLDRTVSELLQEAPLRTHIFEYFAIDEACSGLTLAEACRECKLAPEVLLQALAETPTDAAEPFMSLRLGQLADAIVERHHDYAREQGPRIQNLWARLSQVYIKKEPRLLALWQVFDNLHTDLLVHMRKEESVLFPYCKKLELAEGAVSMHCGSVTNPIRVMNFEHQDTQAQMEQLKALSDDFSPPPEADNSWRELYIELKAYVDDLEIHMQLENLLLFPASARREHDLNAPE